MDTGVLIKYKQLLLNKKKYFQWDEYCFAARLSIPKWVFYLNIYQSIYVCVCVCVCKKDKNFEFYNII